MHIPVSEAKAQLTDLMRRAEAGEEVVLTRRGEPRIKLTPVNADADRADLRRRRLAAIDRTLAAARERQPDGGPDAARSADYLYGEDGLPA